MPGIERECLTCGNNFSTTLSRINDGRGKFCSHGCYWKSKNGKPSGRWNKITKECQACGKMFYVNKARSDKGQVKFCSRSCYGKTQIGKTLSANAIAKLKEYGKLHKKEMLARLHSAQAIEKMGASKKGKPSWNKGRSWTVLEKQNLSKTHMDGKSGLERAQKLAAEFGGQCLSNEYLTTHAKLKFKCADNHEFEKTLSHLLRGQWCSICSSPLISERICRRYFEFFFQEKFPKMRPEWLVNHKGNRLELDGYCEKLKLAFEYQGEQHYKDKEHFYRARTLEEQQRNDEIKKELCAKHNVNLIEVRYNIKYVKMYTYIIEQCMGKGIQIPYREDWLNQQELINSEKIRRVSRKKVIRV